MAKTMFDEKKNSEVLPEKAQGNAVAPVDLNAQMEAAWPQEHNLDATENVVLPWIKVSKEAKSFVIGETVMKSFKAHVLFAERQNAYWREKYDANSKAMPDCLSRGGLVPDPGIEEPINPTCGKPGRLGCCPMNEYGTAVNEKGEPGKGKACKNTTVLMLFVSDDSTETGFKHTPYLLRLTPTSLSSWDKFSSAAHHERLKYQQIFAEFRVGTASNAYANAKVEIERVAVLDSGNAEDAVLLGKILLPAFKEYAGHFAKEAGKFDQQEFEETGDPF